MSATRTALFSFTLSVACFVSVAFGQQPLLQITAPSDQSPALAGQTLTIAVTADPSVQGVYVMTQHPLPNVQPTLSPNQFSLTLPTTIAPGVYQITAVGFVGSSDVESVPIQIDVERQDAPVSIRVKPVFVTMGPPGTTLPVNVQGTFADGSVLSLKNSSLVTYTSDNTSVVTTAPNGILTAVGQGYTTVVVQYGTLGQPGWTATTFQVTVPPPPPTGPAPVITSITPTSGTPGVTQVTVTGSNFGSTQGSGAVELGSTDATAVQSWSDTQIVATVPSGSMPGSAMVYQNRLYSNQIPFTTVVPAIASVSPTSGSGGAQVTISGSNFGATQGTSTILFNGAWTNASSWSDSSIVATVSPLAISGNVVVIVNGAPSNDVPFTTLPSITNIVPAVALPGSSVTVTGTNFGLSQGTSSITFGGIAGVVSAWSPTSITAQVPQGATTGPVLVTVDGSASNASAFTVSPPFDAAINMQLSSTQLVYPGATNVVVCVAPATQATATGTIQVFDSTTMLTTQPLQGNGCAYWYISPGLNAGTHMLTAAYSGDSNNLSGSSAPLTVAVSPVPVNLSASCWNPSFPYGANYQCTLNLSSNGGAPTGSMTYVFDGGTPVTLPLSGGNALFTISQPVVGSHQVVVGYAQQTNYAAATSQSETFTVTPAPVNVGLTPSSWSAAVGTSITLTAAVTSWSAGAPNANGTVSFYLGTSLLATVPVDGSGQASYTTSTLPVGTQTITATYAGGTNYSSGSGTATIAISQ